MGKRENEGKKEKKQKKERKEKRKQYRGLYLNPLSVPRARVGERIRARTRTRTRETTKRCLRAHSAAAIRGSGRSPVFLSKTAQKRPSRKTALKRLLSAFLFQTIHLSSKSFGAILEPLNAL